MNTSILLYLEGFLGAIDHPCFAKDQMVIIHSLLRLGLWCLSGFNSCVAEISVSDAWYIESMLSAA